jgi:hypothetical protein
MKKELKRMWKEAVLGKLEILVPHVAEETEEYYQTHWSG